MATEQFDDYLKLFTDEELGDGPVRILVEGIPKKKLSFNDSFDCQLSSLNG